MTHWLDFFMDGRKVFTAFMLTLFLFIYFRVFYPVYQIEIIPYNLFISLFSKYFEELPPIIFLAFYYFSVSYIFSLIVIGVYDLIIKIGKKNE